MTSVSYGSNDETLKAGEAVTLTVDLSEAVNIVGSPSLTLNDGGVATYLSGTGAATLTFRYTVSAGQNTADLRPLRHLAEPSRIWPVT